MDGRRIPFRRIRSHRKRFSTNVGHLDRIKQRQIQLENYVGVSKFSLALHSMVWLVH